jgi:hypothetical protein
MDVRPPAGYVMDPDYNQVPAFLQQGLDMGKVQQVVTAPAADEDKAVAEVSPVNPYKIKVFDPGLYTPSVFNHELTHTFQETRNPDLPSVATMDTGGDDLRDYDYGGQEGLQVARAKGKTVSDLGYEQQAEMVKDYKFLHDQYLAKAAKGKITPADEKAMYDLQQAYHPFVKQLAEMPSTNENLQRHPLLELLGIEKPATINTRPEPPGLPAYNTPGLGVLPADPLMGGKSQPTSHSKTKKKDTDK